MSLLDKCDFSSYNSEVDHFTAQAILEAQFNIRLRRQTEEKGMLRLKLQCPSCGHVMTANHYSYDSPMPQVYCSFDCYYKAHPIIIPGMDELNPVETKVEGDTFYTDNPDFLEITGV
jgi:ribosomal protein S27AE